MNQNVKNKLIYKSTQKHYFIYKKIELLFLCNGFIKMPVYMSCTQEVQIKNTIVKNTNVKKISNESFDRSGKFFDKFNLPDDFIPKYSIKITDEYTLDYGLNSDIQNITEKIDDVEMIKSFIYYMKNIPNNEYCKYKNQIENSIVYVFLLPLIVDNKYSIKLGYTKNIFNRHDNLLDTFNIEEMILLFTYKIKCEAYEETIHDYNKKTIPHLHFLTEKCSGNKKSKKNINKDISNNYISEKIDFKTYCKETYLFDIKIFTTIMDIIKNQLISSTNEGKLIDLKIVKEKIKLIEMESQERITIKQTESQERIKQIESQERIKLIESQERIKQMELESHERIKQMELESHERLQIKQMEIESKYKK